MMGFIGKKKACLFTLLIFFTLNLSAVQSLDGNLIKDSQFFGFSIEPSVGYLMGETREIVYDSSSSSDYTSELIWDLTDIIYAGVTASFNFKNRLYFNVGLWTALNPGNGYMNDFDWLDGEIESDGHGRNNWTRWSLSSVEIENSRLLDSNVSFDFLEQREFKLSGILGFKSIYWDWSDKILDSYYDGVADVIAVGIDAIEYQLSLNIVYFGIGGGYYSSNDFFVDGRLIYSPLVFGEDNDYHRLRSLVFVDEINFGQYIGFSIRGGYTFSNFIVLSGQISGEYLFETRGSTRTYDDSGNYISTTLNGIGIQYQTLSFSINAMILF